MRIPSVTAQEPHSTRSGVYLTGLVKGFAVLGYEQAVVAEVYKKGEVHFPEGTRFCPIYYRTENLPFPIAGTPGGMPYKSAIYSQTTEDMVDAFKQAFSEKTRKAVGCFRPDLTLHHHPYLLTAVVREASPRYKTAAIYRGTGPHQIKKNNPKREYILAHIKELHKVFCLRREQREGISQIYGVPGEQLEAIGSRPDDSIFRSAPIKKDGGAKCLTYARKLSERKRIVNLLRSLAYLEQVQRQDGEQQRRAAGQSAEPVKIEAWLAGGYGNQLGCEAIRKLTGQSSYPVKFLGGLDQSRLAKRMNQVDVSVLPSSHEGLPLVVMKALACGLQVVCTDLPGVRPWLEENIGTYPVRFVSLPAIVSADEPVEQELPKSERHLAEAVDKSLGMNGGNLETDDGGLSTHDGESMTVAGPSTASLPSDLSRMSQAGIGKKILESCNFI